MTIQIAQLDDVNIAYQLSGPRDAPVVLLSHCFSADHRFWDAHLPACEGLRVLRYDTRGHGSSGRPEGPYSLDMLAGDVIGLLDALAIEYVHFVGVSMGGMIAQTVALAHPERLTSLALVNTMPTYNDEQRVAWRERAALAVRDGIEAVHDDLMKRWFSDAAITNEIAGYRYMRDALRNFSSQSFASVVAAMCEIDTLGHLAQIKTPTMVVAAPEDPGVPARISQTLADEIVGAALHWLSPARHLASLEHVDTFNTLLRAHLIKHS